MISLNPIFKELYKSKKRYILITGGRGGTKSFTSSTFLCQLSYELNQRILFTRYTMTSAEISVIPEFKNKIELLEVEGAFKVNKADIENKVTGNEILFRGLKTSSGMQTANLKSIADISCWCNDESEELIDEDLFDTIDLSIRTKKAHNRVILIMNPSDKTHFIYKRWIENSHKIVMIDGYPVEVSTHHDVLHIHTSYLDNIQHLDKSFVAIAERMKTESPTLYGHKIIGQWRDSNEGSLFPPNKIKRYNKLPDGNKSTLAYIDIADEGNDFLCMVVATVIGSKMYIEDIVFSDANTDVTLPLCERAAKDNGVTHIRCESNSMGAMFKRNLESRLPNIWVGGATSTTNKFSRIYNDSLFILDCMYFKESPSPMYSAAMAQLGTFTRDGKAKHDDVADAMSGMALFARGMLKSSFL